MRMLIINILNSVIKMSKCLFEQVQEKMFFARFYHDFTVSGWWFLLTAVLLALCL